MAEFICPHCDAIVEIVGADGKHEEICDCGAVLDLIEVSQDRDRLAAYTWSPASFEAMGG